MSSNATQRTAKVWVPGSIGNVGPGFDVLGLAVGGLGDRFEIEILPTGPSVVDDIRGRDDTLVPRSPKDNCAVVAALAMLRRLGMPGAVRIRSDRQLPLAGGLGASAAASVGGALGALLAAAPERAAAGDPTELVLAAALEGEAHVAGRHLDNIAPSVLGGVTVVLGTDPPRVARVPLRGDWWVAVASPSLRLATRDSRAVLPSSVDRRLFVAQMARTAALVTAFATADHDLARLALVDEFAEPLRAPLISHFSAVKTAALAAGALGCSISGAGPSVFALAASETLAHKAATAMQQAFGAIASTIHIGPIAAKGALALSQEPLTREVG